MSEPSLWEKIKNALTSTPVDVLAQLADYVGLGNVTRKLTSYESDTEEAIKLRSKLAAKLADLQQTNIERYTSILNSIPKLRSIKALTGKEYQDALEKTRKKARDYKEKGTRLESELEFEIGKIDNDVSSGDITRTKKYSKVYYSDPEQNRTRMLQDPSNPKSLYSRLERHIDEGNEG